MCPQLQLEKNEWYPKDAPNADVSGSIDLGPLRFKLSAFDRTVHMRLLRLTDDVPFRVFVLCEAQIFEITLLEGDSG